MKLNYYLVVAITFLSGCATQKNKNLDVKLSNQSHIENRSDLQSEATYLIENASNLTSEQKKKLSLLRETFSLETNEINRQSLELRSVLLNDIMSLSYNPAEISLIKNRMRKLEDRRLTLTFDTVEKANVILGRQTVEYNRIMKSFIDGRSTPQ